jgi:hypothetical protein
MKRSNGVTRRGFLPAGVAAAVAGRRATAADQAAPSRTGSRCPVLDTADVLVVGGGSAGIGAALGAARAGAKTLLIENHSFFGGVASWSMGMNINQVRPEGKPRSNVHELLIQKLQAHGDQAVKIGLHEIWCNVEYLKVAILDALDSAGVRYLVDARAVDAIVERNRITGVVLATKRGLMALRARVVVDCTGDADVAYYAGAETLTEAGSLMPMTLAIVLANVDPARTREADIVKALRSGRQKYPLITTGFFEIEPIANSRTNWWINHAGTADLGRIDATDPVERSKAECWSRRQGLHMISAIRDSDDPALKQIEWVAAGPQVSIRETRRVKGVYVLTEEDALAGRQFEDAVAWRSGYLDPGGEKGTKLTRMKVHDVPYRALLPEKLDGLLVGGRCISATHLGAAAGKSMGNCMATGHAAGVAAALSAQKGIVPRELKAPELQARLRADGVRFDMADRDQKWFT